MLQYREIFYKQYYSSQLGRNETNYQKKLQEEDFQLKREILPLIPKDKSINMVDLGCGIGSLVKTLSDAGYLHAIGVDVSEEMVKVAHTLGITGVQQGDVTAFLQNNKNTFDVITGIDIIEHFTKDELVALLLQVMDALRPNGIAIFRTPNMDTPFASIFANGDFTHENYLNSSSANQVMVNCGFKEVRVFPGLILIQNPGKELVRKVLWFILRFRIKLELFASGRSSSKVILAPNLMICAKK